MTLRQLLPSCHLSPFLLVVGSMLLTGAARELAAQTATVTTEENFRLEPNGTLLGRIQPGTVLGVEETGDAWVHATLEGWIWTPSLEASDQPGFDLRVTADGGENLRVEPQGTILARLEEGTLLQAVERGDGWIRVRRSAWIWRPSLELDAPLPSDGGGDPAAAPAADEWRGVGPGGLAILSTPDGDTLATAAPGGEVRVLGRRGSWARVQVDGWAWLPEDAAGNAADAPVLADATPDQVAEAPGAYRGGVVTWDLQFISREEAEPVRTDFYEGEPYLLTRWAGEGGRFVYVAVPPERTDEVDALTPLEQIRVVGRIRTGNAVLTGGPILDLLELNRGSGSGGGAREER